LLPYILQTIFKFRSLNFLGLFGGGVWIWWWKKGKNS